MRSKWQNDIWIEGYVFSIGGSGKLYTGVTSAESKRPNTEYINGTLNIATDEEGMNIVPVRFNFVTEKWASGSENDTWKVLKEVMDTGATWENKGKDGALKVRLQCNVGVNDFVGRDGDMVEAKTVECSFAHFARNGFSEKRNDFKFDMVIANTSLVESDDNDDYLNLRGYAFNFRNELIPVTLTVNDKGGIKYFEDADISNANPMVTTVWGKIVSTTQKIEKSVESAWGAPQVEYTTRTLRSWEVHGCSTEPMEWDDETTITLAEFKECIQRREEQKAAAKARLEKSQSRNSAGFPAAGSEAKSGSPTAASDFRF